MEKFCIEFHGYCTVEANDEWEARVKFYKGLRSPIKDCSDDAWDIDDIKKIFDENS